MEALKDSNIFFEDFINWDHHIYPLGMADTRKIIDTFVDEETTNKQAQNILIHDTPNSLIISYNIKKGKYKGTKP